MRTQYSHAAPFIRQRLVYAVEGAGNARTKRDRQAKFAEAFGFASALLIMARSADQTAVDGIAEVESLPSGAVRRAREWLKLDAELVLGPEANDDGEAI